jgi:hypothetical protein
MKSRIVLLSAGFALCLASGCAGLRAQRNESNTTLPGDLATAVTVERGRPNEIVDSVGWVFGLKSKVLLWNRRAENHRITAETEQQVVDYAVTRQLPDVKVRVNQYDPFGEWHRLTQNKRVAAPWRYTFGAFRTLGYTLVPGRLFGEDSYNPYTNTISLYSDIPSLGMEQVAHAEDVLSREHPGNHAFWRSLPFLKLRYEAKAKEQVLAHVQTLEDPDGRAEANKIMHAQFGREVGGQIGAIVPGIAGPAEVAGAITGHVVAKNNQ